MLGQLALLEKKLLQMELLQQIDSVMCVVMELSRRQLTNKLAQLGEFAKLVSM